MRTSRFASAVAALFAAMIGTANAIAEQAGSPNPPEQAVYQTKGIVLDTSELANWAAASYWEQKVGQVFKMTVDQRMQADAAERDAVLATVWQIKPEDFKAETKMVAIIPKRPANPQKDVAYQITFLPRASAGDKDRVEALFVSEGPGVRPIVISPSAGGAIPQLPAVYSYAGFPKNNFAGYWIQHAVEMNAVLTWIARSGNPVFDQILSVNLVEGGKANSTNFHVRGTKAPSGAITSLRILFLGEAAPVMSQLSAQSDKDFADLAIERIQTESDAQQQDKLGAISGLAELGADERLPAKFAIWQYFKSGARQTEIDAIVPKAKADERALLSLRFGPGNNVSVQHIGNDRKGSLLGHPGDLRDVNGFAAHSADIAVLLAWLKRRYPAVTPRGTTALELEDSVTAEIQMRSGTPAWFKDNYGIDILSASVAENELARRFQYKAQQLAGLQDFPPSELQLLEVALEKMSDHLVSSFKGLQMARQKTAVELIGVTTTKLAVDNPLEGGVALLHGHDRAIIIFDSANLNVNALFVGETDASGKPHVAADTLMAFVHELGHMVATMPGVKDAFDRLIMTKKIRPVTWYAASNPKDEFFPEAFALYVGAPGWLRSNRPDLFNWFETFSQDSTKG